MPSESPTPDFRVSALKQTKDYTGSEEEFPGETQRPQIGGRRRQEEDAEAGGGRRRQEEDAEAGGEEKTGSPNHDEPRKQDTDDSSSHHDPGGSWLHKEETPPNSQKDLKEKKRQRQLRQGELIRNCS
ncbi:hypothetical protein NDU88_006078 [Pleurodeles waltl]|uniref:Uncharacterized protein n=1 Tax=Pleurodeles waltl TaxID=8319 RepID=A0AAV7NPB2_PLEWA|nr:hypothetical protein NDU88_006078 [Pleurodeles waltl]